jgi:hypothetical protein
MEDLRGRCLRSRVGLLPDPQGKGTEHLCSMWTPSSQSLYVMVDDLCHSHSPTPKKPGPQASLCASEVITLAIFARWGRFSSERDFYRYARSCLCNAFPTLPDRS